MKKINCKESEGMKICRNSCKRMEEELRKKKKIIDKNLQA